MSNFTPAGEEYGQLLDTLFAYGYDFRMEMAQWYSYEVADEEERFSSLMNNWDDAEKRSFWFGSQSAEDDLNSQADDDNEPDDRFADGDALASAGWGTDEDYGGIGGEDW